jgi:putative endonuclease
MDEHRRGKAGTFTARYQINRLMYFEEGSDVAAAIEREKQLKGWTRKRKIELIASMNPRWRDLSEEWFQAAAGNPTPAGPEDGGGRLDPSLRSG